MDGRQEGIRLRRGMQILTSGQLCRSSQSSTDQYSLFESILIITMLGISYINLVGHRQSDCIQVFRLTAHSDGDSEY